MLSLLTGLLLLTGVQIVTASTLFPAQHTLGHLQYGLAKDHDDYASSVDRKILGRFLHITDIHPDPFYRAGTDPDGDHPCHGGKGPAGYYGAEKTQCDSPFSLVNATFDWIRDNIAEDVDFVVWTGDSARHDNDEKIPRTRRGIVELNEFVVSKFKSVFGKKHHSTNDPNPQTKYKIPIIPTFGNNDILPHNIFKPGPNEWTRQYQHIWKDFVPQAQQHSFSRGGWFYVEVIPTKLAVFSLNTLYFFESNAAVDGCDAKDQPGFEHFEWLRVQLDQIRRREMKAILTGHVPPAVLESRQNWDESCYQKWILWLRQYRDVIVGNVFGHMNIDHFVLQDVEELNYKFPIKGLEETERVAANSEGTGDVHLSAKADYLSELRQIWSRLPTPPEHSGRNEKDKKNKDHDKMFKYLKDIGGPYAERFSLSLISPSVVPNFYPTLRIVEYNISGLEHKGHATADSSTTYHDGPCLAGELTLPEPEHLSRNFLARMKHKKKKNKPNFTVPSPPSKNAPPGPAYSPQTLSWTSYIQLYANLTTINARGKHSQVESVTTETRNPAKVHLNFEKLYNSSGSPYYLPDLTVRRYVDLAEKIGRPTYRLSSGECDGRNDCGDDDIGRYVQIQDKDILEDSLEVLENRTTENMIVKHKKKNRKHRNKDGISSIKKNHLWHAFVSRAFVGSKTEEELEEEFG